MVNRIKCTSNLDTPPLVSEAHMFPFCSDIVTFLCLRTSHTRTGTPAAMSTTTMAALAPPAMAPMLPPLGEGTAGGEEYIRDPNTHSNTAKEHTVGSTPSHFLWHTALLCRYNVFKGIVSWGVLPLHF